MVFSVVAFIIAIASHEAAHAWAAYKLGDTTAQSAGRMTFNPIAHIDPVGTIILPALLILTQFPVVFGWAKPVPVNPLNFSSPRKGMMITGSAGPISNFLVAGFFAVIFRMASTWIYLPSWMGMFFVYCVLINLVIGFFNLIPVPPLDGSNILAGILPPRVAAAYMKISRYGFLIVVALLYFGLFERIIIPAAYLFLRLLVG